jgi:nucleotide-binding universal stress UspA family protein
MTKAIDRPGADVPGAPERTSAGGPRAGTGGDVIVVGVDGSSAATGALRWAVREATERGCAVRVVHAWSFGVAGDFTWLPRRRLSAESAAMLRAVVSRVGPPESVPLVCVSVESTPASAASALVAAARDADLLVIATRRGGGDRLGSVAARCVQQSPVPVVMVADEPD